MKSVSSLPRTVRDTCFICVEGETEEAFVLYLKEKVNNRQKVITIKNAHGKDPGYIITRAVRMAGVIKYGKKAIILDDDKKILEKDRKLALDNNFVLIQSKPCIEGLFLSILDRKHRWDCKTSQECKEYFVKNHLKGRKVLTTEKCKRIFPNDTTSNKEYPATLKKIIKIL